MPGNLAGVQNLLSMMGQTSSVSSFTNIQRGITDFDVFNTATANFAGAGVFDGTSTVCPTASSCGSANPFQGPISKSSSSSNPTSFGHYLVRPATVPEPGTASLLGLGLAGLAWRRRRRSV